MQIELFRSYASHFYLVSSISKWDHPIEAGTMFIQCVNLFITTPSSAPKKLYDVTKESSSMGSTMELTIAEN